MKRIAISFVCIFAFASSMLLAAGPKAKEAWEWTDEERIAALMDDRAAAARLRAAIDGGRLDPTDAVVPPVDNISGERDPHLYLAWELFDHVAKLGFAVDDEHFRTGWRASKEERRKELGLPDDMWERLGVISLRLVNAHRQHRDIALSGLPKSDKNALLRPLVDQICRERYAALIEARAVFGTAFDRFLYTAIAPSISSTSLQRPDAAILLRVSRGCQ